MDNKMNDPIVSILVAVYNVAPFLKKCLNSIVNQIYRNIEIVLVDDCSLDDSGQICDEYSLIDSRIKVIHNKKNLRLPAVRNIGINNSSGKYIMFVDGDDWLAEDCVSYMVSLIKQTKSDMAISLNHFTNYDTKQISNDEIMTWNSEWTTQELIYPHITIGAWNKIYSRDFIDSNNLRFQDYYTAEGYKFITDASQRARVIGVGKRKVYYYRRDNVNSATVKADIRQGMESLHVIDAIEKELVIHTDGILNAISENRFLNYRYVLKLIIETKTLKTNRDWYKKCITEMRKHGPQIVMNTPLFSQRIKLAFYTLFPRTSAYIAIWKKHVQLGVGR